MSNDIDPELLKAFAELIKPAAVVETEYRAYYDEKGEIIYIAPEPKDSAMPESCIVVEEEIYKNSHKFKIEDGEPVQKFFDDLGIQPSLVRSKSGFKVVKNNPALKLEEGETTEQIEYYDYRID